MRVASHRIAIALSAVVPVAAAATLTAVPNATRVTFTDHKLKNGLRVLIAEDHHAPVVSVAIVYNAGSRDERKGRTGFAHLFEHMMFKGSANVADGEHSRLIQNNGGRLNATTDQDRTLYYDTLPANQLDLVLFLEADRMRSLDVSQANLDNQRSAVQEERRLRLDNQPYGRTFEAVQDLAYDNSYKHLPIGSMEDLERGERRRRRTVLQDVLRAEQRRHGDCRRRRDRGLPRQSAEVLRRHRVAAAAARSRHVGAAADRRTASDGRGSARAPHAARRRLQDPRRQVTGHRAAPGPEHGARGWTELPAVSVARAGQADRRADRDVRGRDARTGPVSDLRRRGPG